VTPGGGDPGAVSLGRRIGVAAAGAAVPLLLVLLFVLLWSLWTFNGPGPAAAAGRSTDVILRPGARLPEIAAALRRAHVIGSDAVFVAAAEVTGSAHLLKAGEYDFASRASMARVMAAIRDGRVVRHFVTIPEGTTSQGVIDTLTRADFLSGVAPVPPEGAVLPETYEVLRGQDRSAVLQRMMDARDKLLADLWTRRRDGLPYQNPDQAVILASIIEKETAKPDERPRIAAVFVNRLGKNMRLESDPTVIYGLTQGRPLGHGLKASELAAPSPYNTYLLAGLPPTPIANPGRAALAAALDPPRTDDLYFVADGTGGHVFSASFEEHRKNVARWRAIELARAAGLPR